jgi:hypothetical protein
MSTTTRCSLLGLTAMLALSSAASTAQAETLTINQALSYLRLAVLINLEGEVPIATAQLPGSDFTHIAGTLEAVAGVGNINFPGGSVLDFELYDGGNTNLLPDVGGGVIGDPGTGAPADYGLNVDLTGLVAGPGAVRDALGDVTGGPTAVVADSFDATGLTLGLTAGSLDVNLSGIADVVDSVDISGNSALNINGGMGYTTIVNGMRYIRVPVNLDVIIEVEVFEGFFLPVTARFTGQIVTVPEPGTLALLGIACAALPVVGYRRFRRR